MVLFYLIDNGTHLAKVQFASVKNNRLVFLPRESTKTVYGGTNSYMINVYQKCLFIFYLPDNIPVDETYDRIELGLFVSYTILSIIGIIFACICLWFNLWFRNQKYVSQLCILNCA